MIVGIVGKANVGKSTFFKAATMADILIANYPFATIKPNQGVGFVKLDCVCGEFDTQCNPRVGMCVNKKRFAPVDVIDIAGLVPGAHEGKGMGNQFLDDLRQADVFMHVVDMSGSTNEKGEQIAPGSYDPVFDIRFLEIELDMWILSIIKKGWDKFARTIHQENKDVAKAMATQLSGLKVEETDVKEAMTALQLDPNHMNWSEEDLHKLAVHIRKHTKPMLIIANKMDISSAKENLKRCKEQFPDYYIIPTSSESELALKEAANKKMITYVPGDSKFEIIGEVNEQQRKGLEFIQTNVLDKLGSTGVQEALDTAVFKLLEYLAIFPGGANKLEDSHGNVLPDCFLLPKNSTALDFAAKIHTDLAKNFIAAIDVKTKRKIGRETVLKHRDVVEIMTSK